MPFIIFLGKNFLQTDFFTAKFFWVAFIYCLFFTCAAVGMFILSKKSLVFVLFLAYFSFLQFYFFDIQQIFMIFKDGSTGKYALSFIVLASLTAALISRSSIFRNFVLILLFLNFTLSITYLIPAIGKSSQAVLKTTNIINNSTTSSSLTLTKYPNIFYIIPDGLASPKILKDYTNIDFEHSIKKFEEKGFTVPKHSYSSYNTTHLSLAALFKMDYPVNEKSLIYKDRQNYYPTIRDRNPELLKYLKKNNYRFIIVPPLWGGCPTSREYKCLTPISNVFFSNFFQDYAVSTMFQDSLFNRFFKRFNMTLDGDMDDAGKTAINKMKMYPKDWSEGGVFTMIHMMIPHFPYREKNCLITDRYSETSKEGYKSTVYCSFNRIHELSDFIIKNYPNASIIVQSDHGIPEVSENKKFAEISEKSIDYRLGAFTAVRGCNSKQASKLNQANIVQYIVECLVNGPQTAQFENKSFFGFYEGEPEFGKVFRVQFK